MEIEHALGPMPYQERIAQLRRDLDAIQRQLREHAEEGLLHDQLLDRMRPLYDDLFALHSEFEVGERHQA